MTNSIRIVLAEDDESLLEIDALLRAEGGFTVMGRSTDTVRAVQLADEQKPDLVILDLTMPLMNGIEATRRMRTLLPSTRLLVLSAQTAPTYVGSALQAGADGYITQGYVGESLRIFC